MRFGHCRRHWPKAFFTFLDALFQEGPKWDPSDMEMSEKCVGSLVKGDEEKGGDGSRAAKSRVPLAELSVKHN